MNATYPERPGFKEPTTSKEAAEDVSPRASLLRDRVLALFDGNALTADECAAALGETAFAVRPRLSELRAMGLIEPTDQRRKNKSGCSARVWRAVRNVVQHELL